MSKITKPGQVVYIRLNPKDCMAIADFIQKLGVFKPGMSLGHAASLILSATLEHHRTQGRIPIRSGFEYSEVMTPFDLGQRGNKVVITKAMNDFELRKESAVESKTLARYHQLRDKGSDMTYEELTEYGQLSEIVHPS